MSVSAPEYCWARMGLYPRSSVFDVVINADFMAAGLQSGCFCFINAAIPDICGAAMLVPEIIANFSPGFLNRKFNYFL